MKHKPIADALQYVADRDGPDNLDVIDRPAWVLVCENLYEHALSGNPKVRGSMGRATSASKIIMNRLGGRRKAGTQPAASGTVEVEFHDLTTIEEITP